NWIVANGTPSANWYSVNAVPSNTERPPLPLPMHSFKPPLPHPHSPLHISQGPKPTGQKAQQPKGLAAKRPNSLTPFAQLLLPPASGPFATRPRAFEPISL